MWRYDLRDIVFVGHSVSAMIGALAAAAEPDRFAELILIGPSARYIDDQDYIGGFSQEDIEELTNSFCRADPEIARHFAHVTFTSDNRADLAQVSTPSLVLQCSDDAIAPEGAVRLVARELSDSRLVVLDAVGHCPNLSAPEETAAAIEEYLRG